MDSVATLRASVNCVDESAQSFVMQLIGTCGTKHEDHITVTGRRAIQAVMHLCQMGYRHVLLRSETPGPHVAENVTDCLWVLNVQSETELQTLVRNCGADLRTGGTLTIGFEAPISPEHASRLSRVLFAIGYPVVKRDMGPGSRTFLICRRQEPSGPDPRLQSPLLGAPSNVPTMHARCARASRPA